MRKLALVIIITTLILTGIFFSLNEATDNKFLEATGVSNILGNALTGQATTETTGSIEIQDTTISACGTITTHGTHTLDQDITGATGCMTILAHNVTLDCAGYNINFGDSSANRIGINNNGYHNVTIKNCNFVKDSSGNNGEGIRFTNTENGTILNNSFSHSGTTGVNYAIRLLGTNNTLILENSINFTIDGSYGMEMSFFSSNNTFENNKISVGNSGGSNDYGIAFTQLGSQKNRIRYNNIHIHGQSGIGIRLDGTNNTFTEENNITITSTTIGYGFWIREETNNTILLNNNISSSDGLGFAIRDDTDANYLVQNYLVYNNSFGEIRWNNRSFFGNLTLYGNIGHGINLSIRNNSLALNTEAFIGNINSSANLTLYGLNYSNYTNILHVEHFDINGDNITASALATNCLTTGACQFQNFSNVSQTLRFNSTGFSSFAANGTQTQDIEVPAVFELLPSNGSNFNVSETIEIAANVTDSSGISAVLANVTFPNNTIQQVTLNQFGSTDKYNNSFTIPGTLQGQYNITYLANDTLNNLNETEIIYFTVGDTILPAVFELIPSNGTVYNVSEQIEISANVTDNLEVSIVLANITYSNNTIVQLTLSQFASTDKYNNSFTIPRELQGQYNITFLANDSNNNLNETEVVHFIVGDSVVPAVFDLLPGNGTVFNVSETIEISTNVTDAGLIDTVIANVTFPNNTIQQINLNQFGNEDKYNNSFTIPTLVGQYEIKFLANDSSNNLNETEITFLVSEDNEVPTVTNLTINGTEVNTTKNITITANVTDNVGVGTVLANITYPNTTVSLITLINSGGIKYNNSFAVPKLLGVYNVTIIANDSENNLNNSETTVFVAVDSIVPETTAVLPNGGQGNVSKSIQISVDVTDNLAMDSVRANVTYPNFTSELVTLSLTSNNRYNGSFSIPQLEGRYNLTFLTNDTEGNENNTVSDFFIANDTIVPEVFNMTPVNGTNFNVGDTITIATNVTDNLQVAVVKANVTYPNNTVIQINFSTVSGQNYSNTFTIPSLQGLYTILFIANDTKNNVNGSETSIINSADITNPTISSTTTSPTVAVNGSSIFLNMSATDNVAIATKFANITLPNSTVVTVLNLGADFSQTELVGTYNVTFYVNDSSGNLASTTSNFSTAEPVTVSITTKNSTSNNNANITIFVNGSTEQLNTSESDGVLSFTLPDTLVDILFNTSFSNTTSIVGSIGVRLKNVNLSEDTAANMGIGQPTTSNHLITYSVNTSFTFTEATLTFGYGDISFTDEGELKLNVCDDFDFTAGSCSSSFVESTTATQNTDLDTFELDVTGFSAFGISQGSLPSASSSSSGSSGGGSGGGGGAGSLRQCEDTIDNDGDGLIDFQDRGCSSPIDDDESDETPRACNEFWECGNWTGCVDNQRTRSCEDLRNCNTTFDKPLTEEICGEVEETITLEPAREKKEPCSIFNTDCEKAISITIIIIALLLFIYQFIRTKPQKKILVETKKPKRHRRETTKQKLTKLRKEYKHSKKRLPKKS